MLLFYLLSLLCSDLSNFLPPLSVSELIIYIILLNPVIVATFYFIPVYTKHWTYCCWVFELCL